MSKIPKVQGSASIAFAAGVEMALSFAYRELRSQGCPRDRLEAIRREWLGAKNALRKLTEAQR